MELTAVYKNIIESAKMLSASITGAIIGDREALGSRGENLLDVAAQMSGVAAWIAADRLDSLARLMPGEPALQNENEIIAKMK